MLLHPFLAPQLQTVAWKPVPRPHPEKTSLTWNSAARLQSVPAELGLRLALQMHRYTPLQCSSLDFLGVGPHLLMFLFLFVPSVRADMFKLLSQLQWSPSQRFWKTKTL